MFDFLYNMWIMGRISEDKLQEQVNKGRITEEEYEKIVNTPKIK